MEKEQVGSMVLEFQELKKQRACLRVRLEHFKDEFDNAVKRLDFTLSDSDWNADIDDNGRLSDYPDRTDCIKVMQDYEDVVRRLDKLADAFKQMGLGVS